MASLAAFVLSRLPTSHDVQDDMVKVSKERDRGGKDGLGSWAAV